MLGFVAAGFSCASTSRRLANTDTPRAAIQIPFIRQTFSLRLASGLSGKVLRPCFYLLQLAGAQAGDAQRAPAEPAFRVRRSTPRPILGGVGTANNVAWQN